MRALNAKITRAYVGHSGYQDAMLGLYVEAKFSNGWSGLLEGHYTMCLPPDWKHFERYTPFGYVIECWLQATGARNIEDMVGKVVRVELPDGISSVPIRVGHAVEDDKWFSTEEICEEWKAARNNPEVEG